MRSIVLEGLVYDEIFTKYYVIWFFLIQEGTAPLNLYVEHEFYRASRGGVGGIKSITNYAPVSRLWTLLWVSSFLLILNLVLQKY